MAQHETCSQAWSFVQHCLASKLDGDGVISARLRVRNAQGLHARPATQIVKIVARYKAQVTITYRKKTIDAKSVLGILLLAAPQNATVTIQALGEDAEVVIKELEAAFIRKFEEGPSS